MRLMPRLRAGSGGYTGRAPRFMNRLQLNEACANKNSLQSILWLPRAWVRVASSAQSRGGATLILNAPHAETARWKRRVPRARSPIYAQASIKLYEACLMSGHVI